jgi:hypothetical protein
MACLLEPGQRPGRDAVGTVDTTPTVFVSSEAAPDVTVIAATLNDEDVDVTERMFTLPALAAGVNVLNLVVEGIAANDDVTLMEDCGGGETHPLKTKFAGHAGGGADPHIGFSIHAE